MLFQSTKNCSAKRPKIKRNDCNFFFVFLSLGNILSEIIFVSFIDRIPAWAEEACAPGGPMEEIAKVVYLIRAKPNLVRVRSGFLLKEMLERFRAKKKGKLDPDRALWMYSAHSSTITTLLNGLGFNLVRKTTSLPIEIYFH